MSRLPPVKPTQLIAALERAGFVVVRIRGSHHFLRHHADASRETVVALHGRELPRGTLADILKQAGLTPDELRELL